MAPEKKLTFLCASIESWETPWLLHQPLMIHFRKEHNVLYVMDEPTLDQVLKKDLRRQLPPAGLTSPAPGIHELRTSHLFPRFFFSKFINDLSLRMRTWQIRRAAHSLGAATPVLYMFQPRFRELIGHVGAPLTVFHSHDYYPGFLPEGSRERKEMEVLYDQAMRDSDIVIACGKALFDDAVEARGGTEGVHLIENGGNFDLLTGSVGKVVPKELEGLSRPIVAYVGRINKTVDLTTLANIARARPGWSVVVMGPRTGWSESQEAEFRVLSALPNFRYVEGRPMNEVGAYINAIDVGLISYKDDGIRDFRFPLKMVEYFSFGKPVVSVDLPSIQRFIPLLKMVKKDDEWVAAIEEAMATDSTERRERRIAAARSMDWSEKAKEIVAIIRRRLGA